MSASAWRSARPRPAISSQRSIASETGVGTVAKAHRVRGSEARLQAGVAGEARVLERPLDGGHLLAPLADRAVDEAEQAPRLGEQGVVVLALRRGQDALDLAHDLARASPRGRR